MHVLTLLVLALVRIAVASSVSGDYDCDSHQSLYDAESPAANAQCVSLLREEAFKSRFDVCKTSICYLYLQEPPFIIFDTEEFDDSRDALLKYQRPVRCRDADKLHGSLGGIAFKLHNRTDSKDHYCLWAGPIGRCSFNALVDFTEVMAGDEYGYQFAITGLLLETPQRKCRHKTSAPYIDNSMIIIGKPKDANPGSQGPFYALVKPFRWSTWGLFGATVLLFVIVCCCIVFRFHVWRGRSLVTAFFIFTGERELAISHETTAHLRRKRRKFGRRKVVRSMGVMDGDLERQVKFATKYGLTMTLFRVSLLAFVGVFALFYEVAVVNFLFSLNKEVISQSITSLSVPELKKYCVLKDSALEQVWDRTVNKERNKYDEIPWARCKSARECIEWARDGKCSFVVTFDIVGTHLIAEENECSGLSIFKTQDSLYQFNAGWLYNSRVDDTVREQVDRQILGHRIDGSIRQLIRETTDPQCSAEEASADIGPLIILVPLLFFVFPPLIAALATLFCWAGTSARRKRPCLDRTTISEDQSSRTGQHSEDDVRVKVEDSSCPSRDSICDEKKMSCGNSVSEDMSRNDSTLDDLGRKEDVVLDLEGGKGEREGVGGNANGTNG